MTPEQRERWRKVAAIFLEADGCENPNLYAPVLADFGAMVAEVAVATYVEQFGQPTMDELLAALEEKVR